MINKSIKDGVIKFANKSIAKLGKDKDRAENNIRINNKILKKINLQIDVFNKIKRIINKEEN